MGGPLMRTPEWLRWRARVIGASDWASILGEEGAWGTAYSTWLRITNALAREAAGEPPPEDAGSADAAWGLRTEAMNREWYEEETGRTVVVAGESVEWGDGWLVATPDGYINLTMGGRGVWECKAPSKWNRHDFSTSIPRAHWVQMQAQMYVTGLTWGSYSVIVQPALYWGDVTYDRGWSEKAAQRIEAFWKDHVLTDLPPRAVAADSDLIAGHETAGKIIPLSGEAVELARTVKGLAAQAAAIEKQKKDAEAALKQLLGDAERGEGGGVSVGWRTEPRRGYTVAPSEPRVLRITIEE